MPALVSLKEWREADGSGLQRDKNFQPRVRWPLSEQSQQPASKANLRGSMGSTMCGEAPIFLEQKLN